MKRVIYKYNKRPLDKNTFRKRKYKWYAEEELKRITNGIKGGWNSP